MLSLLALALITGCGSLPATRSAPAAETEVAATALSREDYVSRTARVLADALRGGEAATVQRFHEFAADADPDPAASREIARAALGATRTSGPARAMVEEVAQGQLKPVAGSRTRAVRFPQDEGSHGSALTEWWYVNGHLEGANGATYGLEFTLFKAGPLLHWAHVALTDVQGQRFHYVRQALAPTAVLDTPDKLCQRYGENLLVGRTDGSYLLAGLAADARMSLALRPEKAPLLINGDGRIDMPEGHYSWYYSQTRVAAQGTVDVGAGPMRVQGLTWIDHQWGPFYVSGLRDRWDWFSLQFEDRTEYNLFAFRDRSGNPLARYVNRSDAAGVGHSSRTFRMDREQWWQSPLTRLFYTVRWHLDLPDTGETVALDATNLDQEVLRRPGTVDPLPNYWEGKLRAVKTLPDGRRVNGMAYCEHFGLQQPVGPHWDF